jgi:magnesium transporter
MDELDEELDAIEESVYSNGKTQHISSALLLKKKLLILRQTVAPFRDITNTLLRHEGVNMSDHLRPYYQDVYDHTLRLLEQIDLHRDILSGVMDAIIAQTNNRLNEVMKRLTSISTILMTSSLIAGIYGMNFEHMPELKFHYGYLMVICFMVVVSLVLVRFFKKIEWL